MSSEDGEVLPGGDPNERTRQPSPEPERVDNPPADASEGNGKRERDKEGDTNRSPKRHKEHKEHKHKKHKKHKRDRSHSHEKASRSPSLSDKDDRRQRSLSRGRRDRSRDRRGRSRSRGRDYGRRGEDYGRPRDSERRRSGSRGRTERDRADRRSPRRRPAERSSSRGRREDRHRRDESRPEHTDRQHGERGRRGEEDRTPRDQEKERTATERSGAERRKQDDDEAQGGEAGGGKPEQNKEDEEDAEYRKRVEAQMQAAGMGLDSEDDDEDEEEDEEAAALEAARKRRQAILDKHKAKKEQEKQEDEANLSPGRTPARGGSDDEEMQAGDVDEVAMQAEEMERRQKLGTPKGNKEGAPAEEEVNDGFDMFGDQELHANTQGTALERTGGNELDVDNWDDADGYYKFQMGEKMLDRYEIYEVTGKGVFSNVLRARDLHQMIEAKGQGKDTAIKVIRNNEMMKKCGDKELMILQLLAKDNGADKHNIVQLNDQFEHHGHLCLVFEALSMNLREVIKKFGNNRGINVGAVHKFAKQMFVGLKHLKACEVVHADIKPDNILVNDKHNQIKICDFGSASLIHECEVTPYLVSRWYRAPEITLCLKYDYGIDMWSIATCLYELYTGKVMFPGNTNNDMLRRFQEIKGKFPNKLLKRSWTKMVEIGRPVDFTEDFKFLRVMEDKATKKQSIKVMTIAEKPEKELIKLLMPRKLTNPDEEKMVKLLENLLQSCLILNSEQRFTPEQALKHEFVKTRVQ